MPTFDADAAVRLAERLGQLTDPARDSHMFGGDLQAAVDILGALGEKGFTNQSQITQEKAKSISRVISIKCIRKKIYARP